MKILTVLPVCTSTVHNLLYGLPHILLAGILLRPLNSNYDYCSLYYGTFITTILIFVAFITQRNVRSYVLHIIIYISTLDLKRLP